MANGYRQSIVYGSRRETLPLQRVSTKGNAHHIVETGKLTISTHRQLDLYRVGLASAQHAVLYFTGLGNRFPYNGHEVGHFGNQDMEIWGYRDPQLEILDNATRIRTHLLNLNQASAERFQFIALLEPIWLEKKPRFFGHSFALWNLVTMAYSRPDLFNFTNQVTIINPYCGIREEHKETLRQSDEQMATAYEETEAQIHKGLPRLGQVLAEKKIPIIWFSAADDLRLNAAKTRTAFALLGDAVERTFVLMNEIGHYSPEQHDFMTAHKIKPRQAVRGKIDWLTANLNGESLAGKTHQHMRVFGKTEAIDMTVFDEL